MGAGITVIEKLFVLEVTYAIVDAEGDRLELRTWSIGGSEAAALSQFQRDMPGREVTGQRVLAGNLPPPRDLTRGSGRSIR